MAQTKLAILIETLYKGKGAKDATKDLKGLEKQTDKSSSVLGGMGGTLAMVGAAAGVAAGAIYTAKKAFDFSREGAALNQLEESFELMNSQVFQTPRLLEDMKAASRGTIAEVDLMKGVMTLTAGATQEVASAMAQASPKLIEIAKAANKLNPLLGDTGFLYDSLALGIKRASPMILDNLGLTIKVGETNKKYADSLGKSVKALTASEKQMALLNAAMEAGDILIGQVGGTVDAQTDGWEQLTVAVKDYWNEIKKGAGEGGGGIVGNLAENVTAAVRITAALRTLYAAQKAGIITNKELNDVKWASYKTGLKEAEGLEALVVEVENYELAVQEEAAGADAVLRREREKSIPVNWEYVRSIEAMTPVTEKAYEVSTELTEAGGELLKGYYAIIEANSGLYEAGLELVETEQLIKEKFAEIYAEEVPMVVTAYGDIVEASDTVIWSTNALGKEIILTKEQALLLRGSIDQVKAGLLGLPAPSAAASLATQQAFLEIWREANAAKLEIEATQAALDKLAGTYEVDVDADTKAAMDKINRLQNELDRLGAAHEEGGGTSENYSGPVRDHPTDETSPSGGNGNGTGSTRGPGGYQYQHGANFVVPPGYPNDSFGPLWVQSGEHVQVTPRGKGRRGGVSVYAPIYVMGGGNPAFISDRVAKKVASVLGDNMRG